MTSYRYSKLRLALLIIFQINWFFLLENSSDSTFSGFLYFMIVWNTYNLYDCCFPPKTEEEEGL